MLPRRIKASRSKGLLRGARLVSYSITGLPSVDDAMLPQNAFSARVRGRHAVLYATKESANEVSLGFPLGPRSLARSNSHVTEIESASIIASKLSPC